MSKLHQRLGTTFVYVTHDQTEAMTMADRIAVMDVGLIQQVGTPQELYDHPRNVFVAGFIGSPAMDFFKARIDGVDGKLVLRGEGFAIEVPEDRAPELRAFTGREMLFGVRPENIHDTQFVPAGITGAPLTADVDVTELLGNEVLLHLLAGETKLLARVDPRTSARMDERFEVVVDLERMHVFDPDTQEALTTAKRAEEPVPA